MAGAAGPSLSRRVKVLSGEEKSRLHNSVVKSMVTVHVDPGHGGVPYTAPGTIIMVEQSFCYIVVVRRIIKRNFSYEIEFSNNIRVTKKDTDFFTSTMFGVIKIDHQFDLSQITAVQFAKEPVSMNEKVYLIGLRGGTLTSGFNVNRADKVFFMIDCPPGPDSNFGAPVFDEHEELVGIVFQHIGSSEVVTVSTIKEQLKKLAAGKEIVDELCQNIGYDG